MRYMNVLLPIVAILGIMVLPCGADASQLASDAELAATIGAEQGLWPIESETVLSYMPFQLCGNGPDINCTVNGGGAYRCCGRWNCGGANSDDIQYGSHIVEVANRPSCGSDIGGHPINVCRTTIQVRPNAGIKTCYEDFNCTDTFRVRIVYLSGSCTGCP